MHTEKKLKYKLRRVVDPSKKVPDVNCEVQDLLLEVVDLKREAPDLRSGGIRPNLTPGSIDGTDGVFYGPCFVLCRQCQILS